MGNYQSNIIDKLDEIYCNIEYNSQYMDSSEFKQYCAEAIKTIVEYILIYEGK